MRGGSQFGVIWCYLPSRISFHFNRYWTCSRTSRIFYFELFWYTRQSGWLNLFLQTCRPDFFAGWVPRTRRTVILFYRLCPRKARISNANNSIKGKGLVYHFFVLLLAEGWNLELYELFDFGVSVREFGSAWRNCRFITWGLCARKSQQLTGYSLLLRYMKWPILTKPLTYHNFAWSRI